MRYAFTILAAAVIVGAAYFLLGVEKGAELAEIPPASIEPKPQSFDVELNDSFIARLVTEDADIRSALEGEAQKVAQAADDPMAELYAPKSNKEILLDMMAPWFYMGYRNMLNNQSQGRFKNTNTQRKTGWLTEGGTLEGAEIVSLDADKAVVRFADATEELYYVPEFPEPHDPTVPRTPEQIEAAQRRYAQVYMRKFIQQGKEYDRLRGKKSFEIPSREEQVQSGLEYLEYAKQFAERSGATAPPPEALIDPSELTPEQREAHERYREMFGRTPENVLDRVEEGRAALEDELVVDEEQPDGSTGGNP